MAHMSADNLKSNLTNPAKAYLWEVLFANPIGGGDAESLELRCQTTVIPGRSVGDILIPFKGTGGIRFPGKLTFSHDWPTTFVESSEDAKTFKALHAWNQAIIDARTGIGGPDVTIKADIYLYLLDTEGNVWLKIKLVGCYPKTVDDVPVAYDAEGNIAFAATFSYDYWLEVT